MITKDLESERDVWHNWVMMELNQKPVFTPFWQQKERKTQPCIMQSQWWFDWFKLNEQYQITKIGKGEKASFRAGTATTIWVKLSHIKRLLCYLCCVPDYKLGGSVLDPIKCNEYCTNLQGDLLKKVAVSKHPWPVFLFWLTSSNCSGSSYYYWCQLGEEGSLKLEKEEEDALIGGST